MLAMHDQFTQQMRSQLRTTAMGLGLVRLLQDAGLSYEARATLYSLEYGFQGVAEKSAKPIQESCQANRMKGVTRTASWSSGSASTRIDAAEMLSPPLSIA
jgi:hypothetical protein